MTGKNPHRTETSGAKADPVVEAARQWREHGWDGGARQLAALSIIRVEAIIRQTSTKLLRKYDLSYPRHELLALLMFTKRGELPMGKISQLLMLHPTSVTSTVASLERLGFLERVPHPTDGRATLARITDEGRSVVQQSGPELLGIEFGLEALTEAEAAQVFRLLKKVRDAAEERRTSTRTSTRTRVDSEVDE